MEKYMVVSYGVRVESRMVDSKKDAIEVYNRAMEDREVYMAQMFMRRGMGAWEVVRFGNPKNACYRVGSEDGEGSYVTRRHYRLEDAVEDYLARQKRGEEVTASYEVEVSARGTKLPKYTVLAGGIVELETYCKDEAKREYEMLVSRGERDVEVTKGPITVAKSVTDWFN